MNNEEFTYNDLEEILNIKNRVIRTLLVGGGGALDEEEKIKLNNLIKKAHIYLKVKGNNIGS